MKKTFVFFIITYLLCSLLMCGCGDAVFSASSLFSSTSDDNSASWNSSSISTHSANVTDSVTPASAHPGSLRDNTPVCYAPEAAGTECSSNDSASIDYSNASEGYVMARYFGSNNKIKFRLTGPDEVTYTYNLTPGADFTAFPLSSGNGTYSLTIYENISGTSYATCLGENIEVSLTNEFGPFLYPNQYVNFNSKSKAVLKGSVLAEDAITDLEVVSNIYNYVIKNITYDFDKAATVPSGYVCDVDATLESGKGICLDYAALMATMLRSQRIPTHLEVGYVGADQAYHAWISTYITDIGWVNGVIEFDGKNWKLMDPTFGATTGEKELKKFIGDGTNYTVKYVY